MLAERAFYLCVAMVYNGIYLSVEAVLTLIILYLPPVKKVMG